MRITRFISIIIVFTVYAASGFAQEAGYFRKQVVFDPMNTVYKVFRIPSIITTTKGNILVFAEGRKGKGGDWDPSNMVFRASYDAGNSWTDIRVLGDYGNTMCMSPVPIVDYFTDKIHLIYTVGGNRIFYSYSSNEGLTWVEAKEISAVLDTIRHIYPCKALNVGPGHGTQLTTGRLLVPIWLSGSALKDTLSQELSQYPSVTSVLYSDDFGFTWKIGDIIGPNSDTLVFPNEASCVELFDGSIMFNMRNESANYRRLIAFSPNGIDNWTRPYYSDNFFEPICHASMARFSVKPFQNENRILFVNPDSRMSPWSTRRGATHKSAPKRERSNLTLRLSYDEGVSFPVSKVIEPGIASYSDISVDSAGIIHCIYESGMKDNNKFLPSAINLVSFDLQWASNGKDSLAIDDMPINSNLICAAGKLNPQPIKKKRSFLFKKKMPRTC